MAAQDLTIHPTPTATAGFGQSRSKTWLVEPQLEFVKSYNDIHKIKAIVGTSLRHQTNASYLNVGTGYTNDAFLGSIDHAPVKIFSDENRQYRLQSLYGLVNYNYKRKYLVEFTGRRDGSSRFGPEKQFGNFYSIAAGWVFSNENFFKKWFPVFSYGKIRVSHGTSGNDQIGDYEFLDAWTNTTYPYLPDIPGYVPTKLYNNSFGWEVHKSTDISLNLGFLDDKILISAVYNTSKTNNQLISYNLPSQTGFTSVLRNSGASVGNKNYEFEVSTVNVSKDNFKWTSSANLTISRNKLLNFPDLASSTYRNYVVVGQPLNVVMGYRTNGVNPNSGIYEILDRNGNPLDLSNGPPQSNEDMINLGDYSPRFYGGFFNGIQYRNWKLDVLFQFVKQKGVNYNITRGQNAGYSQFNMPYVLSNRWEKPGDIAPYQRLTQDGSSEAAIAAFLYTMSDATVVDASYVRLRTLSLSYSLPYQWIRKITIKSCNLFVQGQNLLTFTKYKGNHDPENGTINTTGLPPLRIINIGVQASF